MVTYKSRPRSINQQFNFQGSTGLIARFGHVKRGREGEEAGRKVEEGSTVRERKQSADQFHSDSGSEASLLCCRDDGDGGLAGGGGERGRNFSHLGFCPSTLSVCWCVPAQEAHYWLIGHTVCMCLCVSVCARAQP